MSTMKRSSQHFCHVTRRTRSMGVLQIEKPLGMSATASAQLKQKRENPQGTRATSQRGAVRKTSRQGDLYSRT